MNRSDIVDQVALILDSKIQARAVVDEVVEAITRGLVNEGRVHVSGLGSFVTEPVPERLVRNPATGERVVSPAHTKVAFSPATRLRESLPAPPATEV